MLVVALEGFRRKVNVQGRRRSLRVLGTGDWEQGTFVSYSCHLEPGDRRSITTSASVRPPANDAGSSKIFAADFAFPILDKDALPRHRSGSFAVAADTARLEASESRLFPAC